MDTISTTTRNASLADLAALLEYREARKVDVVANAPAIRAQDGLIVVNGTEPVLTESGVDMGDGIYRPTAVADEGLSQRLGIPVGYLKRLRADRPDLYDANVNGWLHGDGDQRGPDGRKFLLRAFRDDDGGEGVLRAFLSDSYRLIDDLDVLTAALDGVRSAGADVTIRKCDLTERRMYVQVEAPAVAVVADALLDGYRSPFTGQSGTDNPLVHAGFRIINSEVGSGAFQIVPEVTIQVCDNGLTMTKDAMRAIHLGSRLDEGLIKWSDETRQKVVSLVTSQARDAVATFLDAEYVQRVIDSVTETAHVPVKDPAATVEHVAKRMNYTAEQTAGILDHFIRGGKVTAGGVMHAVTSYAQEIPDADVAWEFQTSALDAMAVAASIA